MADKKDGRRRKVPTYGVSPETLGGARNVTLALRGQLGHDQFSGQTTSRRCFSMAATMAASLSGATTTPTTSFLTPRMRDTRQRLVLLLIRFDISEIWAFREFLANNMCNCESRPDVVKFVRCHAEWGGTEVLWLPRSRWGSHFFLFETVRS